MQVGATLHLGCAGWPAADTARIGDHDGERIAGMGRLAEQQRDIAATGGAVRVKTYNVSPDTALDDQFSAMAGTDVERMPVWLVVAIAVVCDQPATFPTNFATALAAVYAGAEQCSPAAHHGRLACALQRADDVHLGDSQFIAAEQSP